MSVYSLLSMSILLVERQVRADDYRMLNLTAPDLSTIFLTCHNQSAALRNLDISPLP